MRKSYTYGVASAGDLLTFLMNHIIMKCDFDYRET